MKYALCVVLAWFKEMGIPQPDIEVVFHPKRKWALDFSWPCKMLYLEVQGGIWSRGAHGRGSGIVRDMEKQNAAVLLGWRPLLVVPKELCMKETADMIKRGLGI